jgi:hypothetical protein
MYDPFDGTGSTLIGSKRDKPSLNKKDQRLDNTGLNKQHFFFALEVLRVTSN